MDTSISLTEDGPSVGPEPAGQAPRRGDGLRRLKIATIVAVGFALGNSLWAAWDQGLTYDEYYHVEWARRLARDRVDERESAFRFDSKTPVLIPSALAADYLNSLGIESERTLRFATRLTPVFFLAACLWLVGRIALPAGSGAAWLAVLLASLDPNLSAHASVATTDLAYAMAVLLFAWCVLRPDDSWRGEALLGGAVGVAFAVKYTAVLLLPVALAYVALRNRRTGWSAALRLFVLAAAACVTVSVLYLMVGVFTPLGSLSFRTPALQSVGRAFADVRLPFPRSILTGIDLSMQHDAQTAWSCYFFGSTHPGGVWYYFIVHWLIKTPAALGLALVAGLAALRPLWTQTRVVVIAALFAIHLAYFSFFFSTQIGYRFALLCIPLASILAAIGLARRAPVARMRWLIPLLVLVLAERAPYWGDPIAFTNVVVWPKSRAYWFTADSNLDYGQNRERLERYVKRSGLATITDQTTVTPGLYVINANELTTFGNFRANRWLIDRNIPVVNFGFTYFGFSITGERFEQYMNETRGTPSLASFDDACSGELPHYPPGSKVPFSQTEHPDGGRQWVVCARSRKGFDLGFRVEVGRLFFGRVTGDGLCSAEFLEANQMTWARIAAGGKEQFCLREIPFRRESLPYLTQGYLVVRGQGADVDIRPVSVDRFAIEFGQESVQ